MKDSLSIWLADLFHNQVSVLDVVPLNLGYLAAAVRQTYGDAVSVRLFKYPDKLAEALEHGRPDVLALSNYTWNTRLSAHLAKLAKSAHPEALIVMGGPNVRLDERGLAAFLKARPYVDAYIPLEGESPFCALVGELLTHGRPGTIRDLYQRSGPVRGCCFAIDGYPFTFVDGQQEHAFVRYGSPYAAGILDEFIADPGLVPIFETNRGCPYGCTFCAWGIAAMTKVRKKDEAQVFSDFQYVAEHGAPHDLWFFADANFGLFERDVRFAAELKRIRDTYGYPKRLDINWAKSSGERVLEIMTILKDMVPSQIAVQSFDEQVLANVGRRNVATEVIRELVGRSHRRGCSISTDLLVGCSGETLESHLATVRRAFELGFDNLNINNIRVLPGSGIDTDEQRERFGFVTRHRFIPHSYGRYGGAFVFESEEAIKGSAAMTETQMNGLKAVHFLVYLLWNSTFTKSLLTLGLRAGLNPLDVILHLRQGGQGALGEKVLAPLSAEHEAEWFDTEDDLRRFYSQPEVAEAIFSGRRSAQKLMWKYVALCLSDRAVIYDVINEVSRLIAEHGGVDPRVLDVVRRLSIDRLRLDVAADTTLSKTVRYELDEAGIAFLRETGILPSGVVCDGRAFTVRYEYRREDYEQLQGMLRRFDYDKQPAVALCGILSNVAISFFTYSIAEGSDGGGDCGEAVCFA